MDLFDLTARFIAAVNAGDLDVVEEMMHPDVEFKSSGDIEPMSGVDAVMMYYAALTEAGLRLTITKQHVDGQFVFTEADLQQRRGDGIAIARKVFVRQRWADGVLVEHRSFSDEAQPVDHSED